MDVYLPIAEMPVNAFLILAMGAAVGFLSGIFGVGGGFLMTPFLIFAGIPADVSVATGLLHIIASSVSGGLAHWRRKAVDLKMGGVLIAGGVIGSLLGMAVFDALRRAGYVELLISLSYIVFLTFIGGWMLYESLKVIRAARKGAASPVRRPGQHLMLHRLPFRMRFHTSKLYISAIGPVVLGAAAGFLAAIMGIGGGLIMVPAMIYLLRMPSSVVVGTSLFQVILTTALVALLHAVTTQTVDVILAAFLMIGGVVGVQFGVRLGLKLKGEELRALLAVLVLGVALRLFGELVIPPGDPYSVVMELGQ